MRLIVDANVLMACLISGKEEYLNIFSEHELFIPDFALNEIQEYQSVILTKTKFESKQLREFTLELFKRIVTVPNFLISTQSYLQAFYLCRDIDEKDTVYVALAIEFDILLVTRDEELLRGLRLKGFKNIISLVELMENH